MEVKFERIDGFVIMNGCHARPALYPKGVAKLRKAFMQVAGSDEQEDMDAFFELVQDVSLGWPEVAFDFPNGNWVWVDLLLGHMQSFCMCCNSNLTCKDCGQQVQNIVMIHDDLWLAIADDEKDFICFPCMNRRFLSKFRRKLRYADLKPCGATTMMLEGVQNVNRVITGVK